MNEGGFNVCLWSFVVQLILVSFIEAQCEFSLHEFLSTTVSFKGGVLACASGASLRHFSCEFQALLDTEWF